VKSPFFALSFLFVAFPARIPNRLAQAVSYFFYLWAQNLLNNALLRDYK
jgi:hypothetical protein